MYCCGLPSVVGWRVCIVVAHLHVWVCALRLWSVCSLCLGTLAPFVDYWEVLWLSDVGEVVVLCGGSLVGGVMWEEHKRVPMTDSPKTIATTVPTYVSIIAHVGYSFQVK